MPAAPLHQRTERPKAFCRRLENLERCQVLAIVPTREEYPTVTEQGRRVTGSALGKRAEFPNGIVRWVEELDAGKAASTVRHSSSHQHLL